MKVPAIISDLVLWFVILVMAGAGFYFIPRLSEENDRGQIIHLPFQDANEISRGSAVRMMGTEVGYVKDIHLHDDYVDIVIKTIPGSLPIPSGATFTILFTGLVGSKSIEVFPPETSRPLVRGKPQYITENPIRMRQSLDYQIDMARALQAGAENFANFFGHHQPVEELQCNIVRSQELTAKGKEYMTTLSTLAAEKQRDAGKYLSDLVTTMDGFAQASQEARDIATSKEFGPTITTTTRYITLLFNESHAAMRTFQATRSLRHINKSILHATQSIEQLPPVQRPEAITQGLIRTENHLEQLYSTLTRAASFLQQDPLQRIHEASVTLRQWNAAIEHVNAQF